MNRATSATGWVRNPVMKSPKLDPRQASSYEFGYTLNPITGCLNHDNGLCKGGGFPCYAYRLAHGRLEQRYLANKQTAHGGITPSMVEQFRKECADPFYPRLWKDRLSELEIPPVKAKFGKPKGIFVCDMGELFGDWIPNEWQMTVLSMLKLNPQHRFYLLTKQPQNLPKWSPFPDHCWVGVTATNVKMFVDALNALDQVEAKVKYLSLEPLLDWNIEPYILEKDLASQQLDWLIIGAQTKPYKPPKIEWMQEIVEAADKTGIPVFLKDNLSPLLINEKGFGNATPGTLIERVIEKGGYKLRQEMPS